MKKVLAAILAMASINAFAADNSISSVSVGTISVRANIALFSVIGATPQNICDHHSYMFNLDISTPGGKNMYSALLAAKTTDSKINVVYTESVTPGVQNCLGANMAKPWVIDLI